MVAPTHKELGTENVRPRAALTLLDCGYCVDVSPHNLRLYNMSVTMIVITGSFGRI